MGQQMVPVRKETTVKQKREFKIWLKQIPMENADTPPSNVGDKPGGSKGDPMDGRMNVVIPSVYVECVTAGIDLNRCTAMGEALHCVLLVPEYLS